ncbi:MAG: hypothetical protein ABI288_02435 [Ginsengibacter sp.]
MLSKNKYTFRKFLVIAVWILLGSGTVLLLIAAITKKDNEKITGMEVHISGVQNNYFVDKKDVTDILEKVYGKKLNQASMRALDLSAMEKRLEKDQWVKKAEIFFDNNNVLQVNISEREPVARIFTTSGASFYIDSSLTRLPLSDKFSARVPVFTDFPTDMKVLKKQDSLLLNDINVMSEYITANAFWMAQIDQVDITSENTFVLIPKLGNQIIRFGNADNYKEKFNKLLAFYKQVQTKIGWNIYSVIDVQFKNQVVAVKRDAAEIRSDSLRTIQIMKNIIEEAQKNIGDSTKIQLSQPDDNNDKINSTHELKDVTDEKPAGTKMPEIKGDEIKTGDTKVITVSPVNESNDKKQALKVDKPLVSQPTANKKSNDAVSSKSKVVEKSAPDKKKIKEPEDEPKRVPKAIMPPKSDY